jgi:hypothetical protein
MTAQPILATGPTHTSRLAVASVLSLSLCLPGGVLALILGVFALWQMSAAPSIGGRGAAWFGIIVGGAEIAVFGFTTYTVRDTIAQAHPVASRFVAGMANGDSGHIDATAAAGLKPAVSGANLKEYAKAFSERLGEFKDMRYRDEAMSDLVKRIRFDPKTWELTFSTNYDLDFASGAPAQATLTFTKEYGDLKVVGFKFTSPTLRGLTVPVEGKATPQRDVQDFDSASTTPRGPHLKSMK